MANNYTQFSIAVKVLKPELVESVSEFFDQIDYDLIDLDSNDTKQLPSNELFNNEEIRWIYDNIISDYGGIDGWEHNNGELWVYAEEGANLEVVTFILQKLLILGAIDGNFHNNTAILITWANTCSKMRPDEFSGSACLITKEDIHWQEDSYQWALKLV
jgi:hypothetical protein